MSPQINDIHHLYKARITISISLTLQLINHSRYLYRLIHQIRAYLRPVYLPRNCRDSGIIVMFQR